MVQCGEFRGEQVANIHRRDSALCVPRPIGFFVHHQGHGHIARCNAIIEQLGHLQPEREVVVFCAKTDSFMTDHPACRLVTLPDFHGKSSATEVLHHQPLSCTLDCAPLGVAALRIGMSRLSRWLGEADPALLVVDVSSEVATLARICSVPVVIVRLHGDRADVAHESAHSGAVGILAPFDERLEQPDWPLQYRARTFYSGGLVASRVPPVGDVRAQELVRAAEGRKLIVVISGSGGGGANLASLTMGARAIDDSYWLVLGKVRREGHETDFHNLHVEGWVADVKPYLMAADVVIISPGDSLVHEVAKVGKPLICIPEWCYFNEQRRKAQALQAIGVAIHAPYWPGSFGEWVALVESVSGCDLTLQQSLVAEDAASRSAQYLLRHAEKLWTELPAQVVKA